MTITVEAISASEVWAADMQRWRHSVLNYGVDDLGRRVKADQLFRGASADQASALLEALYRGGSLTPRTELPGGTTVGAILGDDAEKTLRLFGQDLSRRTRIKRGERRHTRGEDGSEVVETRWIISGDRIILGEPTAHEKRLRRMPPGKTFQAEGLRLVLQSVGNTSHTLGVYVYAHRDGAEEAEQGYMSWSAAFGADGQFFWRRNAVRGLHGPDLTDDDIVAITGKLLDEMPERSPVDWMFHANGAINQELEPLIRKRRDALRAIEELEAVQTGKLKSGYYARSTPEQIARALAWRRRELSEVEQVAGRMQMLQATSDTITAWLKKGTPQHGMSIRELVNFMPTPTADASPQAENVDAAPAMR